MKLGVLVLEHRKVRIAQSRANNFAIAERRYLQLLFETFNTTLAAPNLSVTSTSFGTITVQSNSPRGVQLGAMLVWVEERADWRLILRRGLFLQQLQEALRRAVELLALPVHDPHRPHQLRCV